MVLNLRFGEFNFGGYVQYIGVLLLSQRFMSPCHVIDRPVLMRARKLTLYVRKNTCVMHNDSVSGECSTTSPLLSQPLYNMLKEFYVI